MPMKRGNVLSIDKGPAHRASMDQFDELRICIERSFNKLRSSMDRDVAQSLIGDSKTLDAHMRALIPNLDLPVAASMQEAIHIVMGNFDSELPRALEFLKRNPGKILETVWEIQDRYLKNDIRMPAYQIARLLGLALGFSKEDMATAELKLHQPRL
jgi:hypothetical protein